MVYLWPSNSSARSNLECIPCAMCGGTMVQPCTRNYSSPKFMPSGLIFTLPKTRRAARSHGSRSKGVVDALCKQFTGFCAESPVGCNHLMQQPEDSIADDSKGSCGLSDGRELLMLSLSRFYAHRENTNKLCNVVEGTCPVSLRLIDWFVTNYAKKHNTIIVREVASIPVAVSVVPASTSTAATSTPAAVVTSTPAATTSTTSTAASIAAVTRPAHFNVYLSYRSQLKAYSKQMFDPFRRRDRMNLYYEPEKYIETTLGQMNFFRWVIQNGILDYIAEHAHSIERDMIDTQRDNQDKRLHTDNIKVKVVQTDDGNTVMQHRKRRNELSKSSIKNMNHMSGSHVVTFD